MSAGIVLKGVATPTAPPVGYVRLFVDQATGDFYVQDSSGVVAVVGGIGPTGPMGPAGADGADGNTVLNGAVAPTTEGVDGDFYIDTVANLIYGPKAAGVWPAGVSLVGPTGPIGLTGPAGADGVDGVDGRTVLNGVVPPTTEGVDGDFYIDTATSTIYGPKAAGVWPAGVSLIGPTGPAGADGTGDVSGPVTSVSGNLAEFNGTGGDTLADSGTTVEKLRLQSFIIACSDEVTDLATGAAKVTIRMPYPFTVTEVRASATEAPTGSALQADVNEEGVSILSTVISIDAGAKTSTTAVTQPVISDASIADDAEITVDIDAVGSTTPGKGLKVTLIGYAT